MATKRGHRKAFLCPSSTTTSRLPYLIMLQIISMPHPTKRHLPNRFVPQLLQLQPWHRQRHLKL
ncbi:hypothetical protein REPUB_Repub02eG0257800 [Reevesia pubescens]